MSAFDCHAVDRRIQELVKRDKLPNVSVCVRGPEGTVFTWAFTLSQMGDPKVTGPSLCFDRILLYSGFCTENKL